MKTILVFDPGESTGWCYGNSNGAIRGGTLSKNHIAVGALIKQCQPDIVVLESFHLYPQMAKSLAWNSFYPCEVIGVIKYVCSDPLNPIPIVEQAPSVKKYFGGFKMDWEELKDRCKGNCTEHTKDAYMHLRYFMRNGLRKFDT